jgi:hypothetical protein
VRERGIRLVLNLIFVRFLVDLSANSVEIGEIVKSVLH